MKLPERFMKSTYKIVRPDETLQNLKNSID